MRKKSAGWRSSELRTFHLIVTAKLTGWPTGYECVRLENFFSYEAERDRTYRERLQELSWRQWQKPMSGWLMLPAILIIGLVYGGWVQYYIEREIRRLEKLCEANLIPIGCRKVKRPVFALLWCGEPDHRSRPGKRNISTLALPCHHSALIYRPITLLCRTGKGRLLKLFSNWWSSRRKFTAYQIFTVGNVSNIPAPNFTSLIRPVCYKSLPDEMEAANAYQAQDL